MTSMKAESGEGSKVTLRQPEHHPKSMLTATNAAEVQTDVMSDNDVPLIVLILNNCRGMNNGEAPNVVARDNPRSNSGIQGSKELRVLTGGSEE